MSPIGIAGLFGAIGVALGALTVAYVYHRMGGPYTAGWQAGFDDGRVYGHAHDEPAPGPTWAGGYEEGWQARGEMERIWRETGITARLHITRHGPHGRGEGGEGVAS